MHIAGHTVSATEQTAVRLTALSLLGSALSTFYSLVRGIIGMAMPALRSARAFPIFAVLIDIPLSFYDVIIGIKQWSKTPANKRSITGLYPIVTGFIIDSLINAEGLGSIIAPMAFTVAGPVLLLVGFGLASIYLGIEFIKNSHQYKAAKKAKDGVAARVAKRNLLTNGGFMLGSMALVGIIAGLAFSPAGPAVMMGFGVALIGVSLYRLAIKLLRPVTIEISKSDDQKGVELTSPLDWSENAANPAVCLSSENAAKPAVCLSNDKETISAPAAVVIPTLFGCNIPTDYCME